MTEASKRRKNVARQEAGLTGRAWESDRARKRRIRDERRSASPNGSLLLLAAAAFIERDDKARGIRARVTRANGDGDMPTRREREPVVLNYNESARSILGY